MKAATFNKGLSIALDRERKARGLTLAAIGKLLGVSYQQVQKLLSGANACSAHRVLQFAEIFEISVAELFKRAGIEHGRHTPTPQEHDAFMAARYVGRIADAKLRGNLVDFTRKLAYAGGDA